MNPLIYRCFTVPSAYPVETSCFDTFSLPHPLQTVIEGYNPDNISCILVIPLTLLRYDIDNTHNARLCSNKKPLTQTFWSV